MKNICCIYRILNIVNQKIYVGSAICFITRRYKHLHELRHNKHSNSKLQRAYNKYGEENFIFEILEKVENKNDLINIEQKFIYLLNPFYNICRIASSRLGVKASQITKNKQRISKLNQSQETKNKISNTLKLKKIKRTLEEKNRISLKLKGIPFTESHKDNISKSLKIYSNNRTISHKKNLLKSLINNKHFLGLKHTDEYKEYMSDYKTNYWNNLKSKGIGGKKVIQYDLNGNYIKTWNYITHAQKELKIYNITNACKGINNTAGGFKWQYESDGLIYKREDKINPNFRKIIQYDINGNKIKIWDSIIMAANELNLNATNISQVCRGKGKTSGGYIWKYYL